MAKKKIYAVRKGHKTGLFATWAECQKAVSGYSGAEFREMCLLISGKRNPMHSHIFLEWLRR